MHGVTKQGSPHTCRPNELDSFPLARIELAPSAPVRRGLRATPATRVSAENHSQFRGVGTPPFAHRCIPRPRRRSSSPLRPCKAAEAAPSSRRPRSHQSHSAIAQAAAGSRSHCAHTRGPTGVPPRQTPLGLWRRARTPGQAREPQSSTRHHSEKQLGARGWLPRRPRPQGMRSASSASRVSNSRIL